MARLKLLDGEWVQLRSERGSVVLPVRASTSVAPTQVFLPMHWGEEVLSGRDAQGQVLTGVNGLTLPALCPTARQPELKHAAVRIEKMALPWRLTAVAWLPEAQALAVRERLKSTLSRFDAASLMIFGREPDEQGRLGLVLRAGAQEAPDAASLADMQKSLGLTGKDVLHYLDAHVGMQRILKLQRDIAREERLIGFWLAGVPSDEAALLALLQQDQVLPVAGRMLLAPGGLQGRRVAAVSPQVCTCFNISQDAICKHLQGREGTADARLQSLQSTLKCGTNCGSCMPALRGLVRQSLAEEVAAH